MDPAPTPFVAQPPLVLPATTPVLDPTLSAPPAPSAGASPNFVTCSDFSASIGELRQFLQDKIVSAVQAVTSALLTSQPAPTLQTPYTDNPAALPALPPVQYPPILPTRIGEYQPSVTYPWLPVDLIDKAHQDILSIYDLPKLANPSWPGATALEEPAPVLIKGFSVVKGPTTSTSTVSLSKQSSTSNDRDLPVRLGRFYQHVANLTEVFPWDKVAGYVIAVCTSRLGKATAADWARFNTELHATHFQGVQARLPPSSAGNKKPALRHDNPRCEQAASGYWTKALLNYPDRPFVNQLLGAIDHGVHLGYSGPLRSHSRFRRIKNLPMDDRGNTHIPIRGHVAGPRGPAP
ncbi:uncharacterized protein UDID_18744 [Ustilago sp. UG-2017a]|nr:uncharacterized protein UDID_18744 [Ustilago sp. UG-2017a]